MRKVLLVLAIFLLATSSPLISAQPVGDGSEQIISTDTTWDDDSSMDGTIIVRDSATLTINGDLEIAQGSIFTVEAGSTMIVNGELEGVDDSSKLRLDYQAKLMFNFGDIGDTGKLRLTFDHTISTGYQFDTVFDGQGHNVSGSNSIDIDVPLDGTDINLTFESNYPGTVSVLSAQAIYGGGNSIMLGAGDIESENTAVMWGDAGFTIRNYGELVVTNAKVKSADIDCSGICSFSSVILTGSAPLNVQTEGDLSIDNSTFIGSRTDEDIIVHDLGDISYNDNIGTGGQTDAWIRLLSQRVVSTNLVGASVYVENIGYLEDTRNDVTGHSGDVSLGTSEMSNIVEWLDSSGEYHRENGTVTITLETGWGDFSTEFAAPHTPTHSVLVPLPRIEVTEVALEDESAIVNKSTHGMVTITNTGDATARANVRCYEGDVDADTAPSTLSVTLAPGASEEVPITWWTPDAGDKVLTCKPLIPAVFDNAIYDIADLEGASSHSVAWEYGEEEEESMLLFYVLIAITLGVAAYVALGKKSQEEKIYSEEPAQEASDSPADEPAETTSED